MRVLRGRHEGTVKALSPIVRRPSGGGPEKAEGLPWVGVGLPPVRVGHMQSAHVTNYPAMLGFAANAPPGPSGHDARLGQFLTALHAWLKRGSSPLPWPGREIRVRHK
eukprot:11465011-Alexandrium_andersonii.AAC.1